MSNKIIINIGAGSGGGKTTLTFALKEYLESFGANVSIEDTSEQSEEVKQHIIDNYETILDGLEMDVVIRTTKLNRSGISHTDIHSYNHPDGYKVRKG